MLFILVITLNPINFKLKCIACIKNYEYIIFKHNEIFI